MQKTLDQEITVEYHTQEWSEESRIFDNVAASKTFESLQPQYRLSPPNYCMSTFTVSGDKFLRQWNWAESVESPAVSPVSVDARTYAVVNSAADDDEADASNQIGSGDQEGLGGSAPCDISFQAYVTDGVIHNEWQLTRDPNFENIDFRFTTQDLDYTFLDEGTHYLRYIGSNADGSCEYIGETYEVNIGESQLLILMRSRLTATASTTSGKWHTVRCLSFNATFLTATAIRCVISHRPTRVGTEKLEGKQSIQAFSIMLSRLKAPTARNTQNPAT